MFNNESHEFKLSDTVARKQKNDVDCLKVPNDSLNVVDSVEDYTSLKEHVNEAFDQNETENILTNLSQLTNSQINNDFNRYTLEKRQRFGTSCSESTNSIYKLTTRSTRFVKDPHNHLGTYTKNFQRKKIKNHNQRISKMRQTKALTTRSQMVQHASSDQTWII